MQLRVVPHKRVLTAQGCKAAMKTATQAKAMEYGIQHALSLHYLKRHQTGRHKVGQQHAYTSGIDLTGNTAFSAQVSHSWDPPPGQAGAAEV